MARKKKKRAGKSVMKIGGRLYPIKIRKYDFPVTIRKVDENGNMDRSTN